jgi:hypothetical protein
MEASALNALLGQAKDNDKIKNQKLPIKQTPLQRVGFVIEAYL